MRTPSIEKVGFLGLGTMGEPMARRLAHAGRTLVVWNRSPERCVNVAALGATVAPNPAAVFEQCRVIILMLVDGDATDTVLARHEADFRTRVADRLIINMATTPPSYSRALEADILAAGGRYVEAPVSGSRKPAETGQLVAMLAGAPDDVSLARPLLAPLYRDAVLCGAVPNALHMKLAVNLFLTAVVTGLAEAAHFAESHKLDMAQFVAVLDAGPLASDVSRGKATKLLARDFTVQASITNVLENVRLIAQAARDANISSPVLDTCHRLFDESAGLGLGGSDMVGVIHAIERRTQTGT